MFDEQMYRLNKYYNYNLIKPLIYLNKFEIIRTIDNHLNHYNLSIIKLFLMFFISIVFYSIRRYLYSFMIFLIKKTTFLQNYSVDIMQIAKNQITWLLVILNLQLVVYIFNNFSPIKNAEMVFNISYTIIITLLIFRLLENIFILIV